MTTTFSAIPAADCEISEPPVQQLLTAAQAGGKKVSEKPCFAVSAIETTATVNAKRRMGCSRNEGIDSVPCTTTSCREVTKEQW